MLYKTRKILLKHENIQYICMKLFLPGSARVCRFILLKISIKLRFFLSCIDLSITARVEYRVSIIVSSQVSYYMSLPTCT